MLQLCACSIPNNLRLNESQPIWNWKRVRSDHLFLIGSIARSLCPLHARVKPLAFSSDAFIIKYVSLYQYNFWQQKVQVSLMCIHTQTRIHTH